MSEYGAQLFGKDYPFTDEKIFVCIHDIDVSGVLTQGWWDLPNNDILNVNDNAINDVLVFVNRGFIKYFDGTRVEQTFDYQKRVIDGQFHYYRPVIRKYNGRFQIKIASNVYPWNQHGYINFEGIKLEGVYTYHHLNGKYFVRESLKSARLKLKIVIPIKKITQLPEYGVAIYNLKGECVYCNSVKGMIKKFRTHNINLTSSEVVGNKPHHVGDHIDKAVKTKLNENEFVLLNPIGYYDECYNLAGRGAFSSGEIIPAVNEDGTVKLIYTTNFSPGIGKKGSFPSQSNEFYSNCSIVNSQLLIAEF